MEHLISIAVVFGAIAVAAGSGIYLRRLFRAEQCQDLQRREARVRLPLNVAQWVEDLAPEDRARLAEEVLTMRRQGRDDEVAAYMVQAYEDSKRAMPRRHRRKYEARDRRYRRLARVKTRNR